jgi:hypothetical protein
MVCISANPGSTSLDNISNMMAVAVAGGRQRIDRIHLIAGRDERLDPQAAVSFDAYHDVVGFLGVTGQELMKHADADESLG